MAHDWPGNVRELENVIERAYVLCRDGVIDVAHLPEELTGRGDPAGIDKGRRRAHDLLDAHAVRDALERSGGHRAAAARALGIHKTTLFRRAKRFGIALPARDGRSSGTA
jgi:transcriptional regulator of acetoin/glycerol metabolism